MLDLDLGGRGKDAETMMKLLDAIDEHDDVTKVHSNFDMDEALLAANG